MMYLSTPPNAARLGRYHEHDIGVMMTPNMGNDATGIATWPYWAADNGCFTAGDSFDLEVYLTWLAKLSIYAGSCLFATGPDVVCDAAATWERSRDVLPTIRQLGYSAALVAQNGIGDGPIDWTAFDVLFIGGDDAWKDGPAADDLMREAKRRGKWVHVGRVNSRRRLRLMQQSKADSADGTYLSFGPDKNLPKLARWLAEVRLSRPLFAIGATA